MQALSATLGIVCLLIVGYQDLTTRSVQWMYFPLLAVAGALYSVSTLHSLIDIFINTICNLAFLLVQFGLLKLYFAVIRRKPAQITDSMIGWGDICFFVSITLFFSPVSFITFYLLSLIFAFFVSQIARLLKIMRSGSIPLAGLQALLLLPLLVSSVLFKRPIIDDHWVLEKIIFL